MFHQQSRCDCAWIRNLWVLRCARNNSMFVNYLSKIDISLTRLITRCACLIIVISSLLPPICRNVQHCDRRHRGNSSPHSLRMFRFESCILFLGMHSGSGSRTRTTTQILAMNHGWNCTFVKLAGNSNVVGEWLHAILYHISGLGVLGQYSLIKLIIYLFVHVCMCTCVHMHTHTCTCMHILDFFLPN